MQSRPNNASTHRLLGDLYRQAGMYPQAIAEFQAALKIDANDAQTYEWLASAHMANGQTDTAQKSQTAQDLWRKKLETLPTHSVDARLARGDVQMSIGDYPGALTEYQAAQSLASNNADAQHGIGNVYYYLGNLPAATRAYEQWTKIAPNDAGAHILLGLAYIEAHQTASATTELQRAQHHSLHVRPMRILRWAICILSRTICPKTARINRRRNLIRKTRPCYTSWVLCNISRTSSTRRRNRSNLRLLCAAILRQRILRSVPVHDYQGVYQKAATARETAIKLCAKRAVLSRSIGVRVRQTGSVGRYGHAVSPGDCAQGYFNRAYLAGY